MPPRPRIRAWVILGGLALLAPACVEFPILPLALRAVLYLPVAPTGQWTWHAGSDVNDQPGIYGTQGTPATGNTPGARMMPGYGRDSYGGLWLFGGRGYDSAGAFGEMNDTWRWNGSSWVWVKGSKLKNAPGVYGTKGAAADANIPGGRDVWSCATDGFGRLWIFGGNGFGATTSGELSDLWRLDGANWVWLAGTNEAGALPVHGTPGVAAAANTPGGREQALAWIDPSGNFWLFGGYGPDSTGSFGHLNDLWKFDGSMWTWVSGSSLKEQSGVYGVQGTPNAANVPGARSLSRGWTDASGNLWLFGGYGRDSVGAGPLHLNDLWKYDGANWTWVKGANVISQPGVYGTPGVAAAANTPGARFTHTAAKDSSGNFWLMGGDVAGLATTNDVWRFDGSNWTWMTGAQVGSQGGTYGTLGTPSPVNQPGSRGYSASWFDAAGQFWVFGGQGIDSGGLVLQMLNDLWRYSP